MPNPQQLYLIPIVAIKVVFEWIQTKKEVVVDLFLIYPLREMYFSQIKYNHSCTAVILAIDSTKTVFEWIQMKKEVSFDLFLI
jgi:hypothetical protein